MLKFLTVDDSVTMRKLIQRSLAEMGHKRVYEAGDGEDGLSVLDRFPDINVVFVDFNMPRMDGLEFVRKVREQPRFRSVKLIMVTTEHTRQMVFEAGKAGVDRFIAKPINDKKFIEIVSPVLAAVGDGVGRQKALEEVFTSEEMRQVTVEGNELVIHTEGHTVRIDLPAAITGSAIHIEKHL